MKISPQMLKKRLELMKMVNEFHNVSEACKAVGISRNSYYRLRKLYESGGECALMNINRKKSVCTEVLEKQVLETSKSNPHLGKYRIAKILKQSGIFLSATTVNAILRRNDLNTSEKRRNLRRKSYS